MLVNYDLAQIETLNETLIRFLANFRELMRLLLGCETYIATGGQFSEWDTVI